MRGAIPPPSGSHRLGSFVETNKTATRGILPDASSRLTTQLLSITQREQLVSNLATCVTEISVVEATLDSVVLFFSKRRAGSGTIERQNTVYEGGILL